MRLMPSRKTVTRQTIIGEKGIALISRRCLEMGFIFHPRRVDHGIDGHIDLVDPASGALLNHVLLVQSKAQDRPFSLRQRKASITSATSAISTFGFRGTLLSSSSCPIRAMTRHGGSK